MNSIDISQVASKLRADIIAVIRGEVYKACEEALRNNVMKTVYSGKSPVKYERSYGFLNAVDILNLRIGNNKASFDLTINPAKMGLTPAQVGAPRFGQWGQHMGFMNQDFREGLVEVLDQGGGSRYYMHKASHFFDKTEAELNKTLVSIMVGALRSRGWDAEVG